MNSEERPGAASGVVNGSAEGRKGIPILVFEAILVLVVVVGVGYFFMIRGSQGAITLLVRDTSGGSVLETISLGNGSLTPIAGGDAQPASQKPAAVFNLSDGSAIMLVPAGIVLQKPNQGPMTLLVGSAVPGTEQTPFAVSHDGARIAWINPSDASLQIFERNPRGGYSPVYLSTSVKANSLGFTADGSILVIAKAHVKKDGPITTEISIIKVGSAVEQPRSVATVSGFARIISP